jgi:hypothetical protein
VWREERDLDRATHIQACAPSAPSFNSMSVPIFVRNGKVYTPPQMRKNWGQTCFKFWGQSQYC